ncbi:MAG: hypothetical protein US65_C0051G0004 [Candidatus Yanofskybacteria bacterium GW2011_GWC2_37_9]|uniref:Uncharacterized protein n=1 Tax=Candidatus Yanofskybacteria bacterium GW2011_GWC2_37_9 TaxID=1619028 RepID=A0A0G0KYS8_9BACT|nr:MAG: hypothetical protein US65_C0051G0004 [Candidatus Yanofskybacteria bacterium GW2011_GWC2_37_9]
MSKKIFKISFALIVVFVLSLFTVVHADTISYTVTGGTDASSDAQKIFTQNDISKLQASDSEPGNGIDRMGSDKWSDQNSYDESRYIEFLFNPNIPQNALISEVKITNEFQRSAALAGAKIEVWDGQSFVNLNGTTLGTIGEDHTDIVNATPILNTPDKINNIKIRFLAYRETPTASGTTTKHDFMGLSITFSTPTDTTDTTPPVITLTGSSTVNLNVGDTYTDAGAIALDDGVTDLTSSIVTVNPVDVHTTGTYTVTYNVADLAGNPATQVTRTVVVNVVSISNIPDPVSINLKIYAGDIVLFNGPKTVMACAESPAVNTSITVNGKCAIEQSGLSNTWTWNYAPSGWLDELGSYTTTPDFSKFWGYFSNLEFGTVGLNQHSLSAGEELLLTYNSYPLRISASKNSGVIGDQIIFTAEEESTFNPNPPYNIIWTPSLGVLITLGIQSCTTIADGTCSIILSTAGSLNAIGSKTLYVPSANLTIIVSAVPSGGDGGSITATSFDVTNALNYLKSAQAADGSFGGADLYTDWAGIAFGALNVTDSSRDLLLSYLNSHNSISSLLTDNERHAMALLALGQNPYSFNGVNYINAIVNSFDNIQFGDANLVNDDIFALIPLGNSGYTKNDDIIAKDIAFIISKQKTNGSWEESVDITAAAIQALKSFESIASVAESLSKATNYIISKQNNDGGFGDSASSVYSTSWAMQAMGALGESWTKDGYTASFYLGGQQAEDGAALPSSETLSNRIWATSYAIAGNSLKPWSEIMESFPKPATQNNSNNSSNTSTSTNTSTVYKTSTNSPQTNPETKKVSTFVAVNTPVITPVIDKKTTPISETKKPTTVPKNLSADTEEIVSGALTAAAVNALPIEETPKNTIPIALGVGTGIVLLYITFKFFVA